MPNTVLCLMGPTAAGKTDLAIELLKHFPCDIVSVDSAMIYRGMDIGTAKPTAEELAQAPHRLIDMVAPDQSYSVAQFLKDANAEIDSILRQGRLPLLVGGTMMYFNALQQGLHALPAANDDLRNALLQQASDQGWESMHRYLSSIDPKAALRIKPNDKQRLIRAIEVYRLSGKPLSEHWAEQERQKANYNFINIALFPEDRAALHQRIAQRFDLMLATGFIDECRQILEKYTIDPSYPAMRSVGYRQAYAYIAGEYDKGQMREKAIIATRQLAKRQLTWLRHWPDVCYFDSLASDSTQEIISYLNKNPDIIGTITNEHHGDPDD